MIYFFFYNFIFDSILLEYFKLSSNLQNKKLSSPDPQKKNTRYTVVRNSFTIDTRFPFTYKISYILSNQACKIRVRIYREGITIRSFTMHYEIADRLWISTSVGMNIDDHRRIRNRSVGISSLAESSPLFEKKERKKEEGRKKKKKKQINMKEKIQRSNRGPVTWVTWVTVVGDRQKWGWLLGFGSPMPHDRQHPCAPYLLLPSYLYTSAGLRRSRLMIRSARSERSSSRYIPRHKRHLRSGHVTHARHFSNRGHRENLDRYFGLISVNPNWFADSVGKTVDSVEIWKYNSREERERSTRVATNVYERFQGLKKWFVQIWRYWVEVKRIGYLE